MWVKRFDFAARMSALYIYSLEAELAPTTRGLVIVCGKPALRQVCAVQCLLLFLCEDMSHHYSRTLEYTRSKFDHRGSELGRRLDIMDVNNW